jgi:hypothetical protein
MLNAATVTLPYKPTEHGERVSYWVLLYQLPRL